MASALPMPVKPTPMRRLASLSSRCCGSGHQVSSSTLSSARTDRKSTRLNSSHQIISYAVFCLKKKKKKRKIHVELIKQLDHVDYRTKRAMRALVAVQSRHT